MLGHLERLVEEEIDADWSHLLPSSQRRADIEAAFDIVGDELLRPVFDELGGEYSYNEIRLTRLARRFSARYVTAPPADSADLYPRSILHQGDYGVRGE